MIAEPLIIIRDDVDFLVKLDALGLRIDFAVVEILLAEKSFCGLDERRFDALFDVCGLKPLFICNRLDDVGDFFHKFSLRFDFVLLNLDFKF